MVLVVHSDASYPSKSQARSRAGGHFFMSKDSLSPPNNGDVLNIAHIMTTVMSLSAEEESDQFMSMHTKLSQLEKSSLKWYTVNPEPQCNLTIQLPIPS